jgi:phosphatidylglycerophosphate synthase
MNWQLTRCVAILLLKLKVVSQASEAWMRERQGTKGTGVTGRGKWKITGFEDFQAVSIHFGLTYGKGARGSVVVKAVHCKPEGRGFEPMRWIFKFT